MKLESNRSALTWYPILAVGLSMVAFILIKTGRDAVFFLADGLHQLPTAYVWIAIASVPAALIHLKAMDRWGARKTRTVVFFLAACIFLIFVPVVNPEHRVLMTALFIVVPTMFAAVFAGAWLLAGDLLEEQDQTTLARVYSRIGVASMLGGICGGLLAKGLSVYVAPRYLVAAGSIFVFLAGVVVLLAHRKHCMTDYTSSPTTAPPTLAAAEEDNPTSDVSRSQWMLFKERYVLVLAGISAMATLAALFIDFQFYATATLANKINAQFFATFYVILNTASLTLQLFVAPRLQTRFGLAGSLILFPSVLLGGASVFAFWATIQARALLKVTEGGLKSSLYRSMWEQTYLLIDRRYRDRAKATVDGTVARIAEGLGALVLLLWLSTRTQPLAALSFSWISWLIIASILIWLVLTYTLNRLGCATVTPTEGTVRLPDS